MDRDSVQGEVLRKLMKMEGRAIEDDIIVNLLLKRIAMKDCQSNGWILEDFPKSRNQALFLAKRGLVPSHLIYMRQNHNITYERSTMRSSKRFGCIPNVLC